MELLTTPKLHVAALQPSTTVLPFISTILFGESHETSSLAVAVSSTKTPGAKTVLSAVSVTAHAGFGVSRRLIPVTSDVAPTATMVRVG